ncbi:hypothetical protein C0992_012533 [Termitomyces sp. T32_za158]|nr:hypothetical protein C0992_012533 [Termitomyces sp. T32_za158]
MHNLFLGLVKEHFLGVLGYDPFTRLWGQPNPGKESLHVKILETPDNPLPTTPQEQSSVCKITAWLKTPIDFDDNDHIAIKQTVKRWSNAHLALLIYIAKGIGCILLTVHAKGKDMALPLPAKPLTKVHIDEKLLDWASEMFV